MEQLKQKCKDCGSEFWRWAGREYCKKCSILRNRRKGSESSTKRMIRNREFIYNYKKDKKCEVCGYNKYPEILAFHHKNKEIKGHGINILMKTLQKIETIKNEIEKCMLLCPNCHNELHLKEKYKNKENVN